MELFMIKTGFCVRTLLLALLFSVISPLPLAYSELSLFLAMIFNVHIYIELFWSMSTSFSFFFSFV